MTERLHSGGNYLDKNKELLLEVSRNLAEATKTHALRHTAFVFEGGQPIAIHDSSVTDTELSDIYAGKADDPLLKAAFMGVHNLANIVDQYRRDHPEPGAPRFLDYSSPVRPRHLYPTAGEAYSGIASTGDLQHDLHHVHLRYSADTTADWSYISTSDGLVNKVLLLATLDDTPVYAALEQSTREDHHLFMRALEAFQNTEAVEAMTGLLIGGGMDSEGQIDVILRELMLRRNPDYSGNFDEIRDELRTLAISRFRGDQLTQELEAYYPSIEELRTAKSIAQQLLLT